MNHYFFRNRILVALGLALSTVTIALTPMEAEETPRSEKQQRSYNPDAGRMLINATKTGNLSMVETALRSGADPDFCYDDEYRSKALHNAAFYGKLQIIEALIKAGADVNAQNSDQETPLHKAVWKKQKDAVELLIKLGAKINVACHLGNTPLHYAATAPTSELTQILIEAGADIEARTDEKAFISACISSVNDNNASRWTPLHYAAARGVSHKVIQVLLDRGARHDSIDGQSRTALDILQQRLNDVKRLTDSKELTDNLQQMIRVLKGEQPLPEHLGVTTVSIDPSPQLPQPQISVTQRVIGLAFWWRDL